ncbi:MAG: hypothetical protein AAF664_01700 [Planctomycetota bacterium]
MTDGDGDSLFVNGTGSPDPLVEGRWRKLAEQGESWTARLLKGQNAFSLNQQKRLQIIIKRFLGEKQRAWAAIDAEVAIWILPLMAQEDPMEKLSDDAWCYEWLGSWLDIQERRLEKLKDAFRLWLEVLICFSTAWATLGFYAALVVPEFRSMYDDFGIVLPVSTRMIIALSDAFLWITIPVVVVAVIILAVSVVQILASSHLRPSKAGWLNSSFPSRLEQSLAYTGLLRVLAQNGVGAEQSSPWVLPLINAGWKMDWKVSSFLWELPNALNVSQQSDLLAAALGDILDRTRRSSRWITWAARSIAFAMIGLGVGFLLTGLFLPMVSLITELT